MWMLGNGQARESCRRGVRGGQDGVRGTGPSTREQSRRTIPEGRAAGTGGQPRVLCVWLWLCCGPSCSVGPAPPLPLQGSNALFCDPTTDSPQRSKETKQTAKTNAQPHPAKCHSPKHSSFPGVSFSPSLQHGVLCPLRVSSRFPEHTFPCTALPSGLPTLSFLSPAILLLSKVGRTLLDGQRARNAKWQTPSGLG